MTDWLIYLILGFIQGITEILPISSSGHLQIMQEWMGITNQDFGLEIFLHLGSLIAVVLYFHQRLWGLIRGFFAYLVGKDKEQSKPEFLMAWYLIIATLPAALVGVLFEEVIGAFFSDILYVGLALWITAALLLFSSSKTGTRSLNQMTWWDALSIGLFQVLGILPGVSRSGSTLSGGLVRKFQQSEAAEFAFLLFIPISLGSALLKVPDYLATLSIEDLLPQLAGFLVSMVATYVALSFLLTLIRRGKIHYFAYYCLVMGAVVITYGLLS